jgi:hypothetical protein
MEAMNRRTHIVDNRFDADPYRNIIHYLESIMTTLDDLTTAVATLTTDDTAEKAAIDALVALVATLQPGTLTAEQQTALDAANAALAEVAANDAAETAEIQAAMPTPTPVATPAA